MARTISKDGLEQRIEKVQGAITKNREQYDRLTAELEELHNKQKAIQSEELLKAITKSSGSYEEIMKFIQGERLRLWIFYILRQSSSLCLHIQGTRYMR